MRQSRTSAPTHAAKVLPDELPVPAIQRRLRRRHHFHSANTTRIGAASTPVCFAANANPVAMPTSTSLRIDGCFT